MKKGTSRPSKTRKPRTARVDPDDILPEYDFSRAERNRFAERYGRSENPVTLDPDVAAVFPNAESVNRALRALAGIIQEHAPRSRAARGRT